MENDNESEISFKSDHRENRQPSFTEKMISAFTPKNDSFLYKYFTCCLTPKEEVEEISDLDNYDGDTYMCNEEINGVMSLFPSKYIRQDEKENINFKFDKANIIEFMNKLENEPNFVRKFDRFNKFGLRMFMKDKNNKEDQFDISETIPITRCQIEIPFSLFPSGPPSVEQVGDAIINPSSRLLWDDNLKEYKILKQINSNTETIKIVTKKQLEMIIPREFYDKRTHFIENGIFYCYSSSAPDSIRPPKKNPIRVLDYFGVFKVWAENNQINIDSFHQIDIKIGQPGPLIFMSLPLKMKEFTENLIKFLHH
jgi:hypothetical protein